MTGRYSLVIEGDDAGYSAYVPETEELTARASEAIQAYWQAVRHDRPAVGITKEIEVELPA